MRYFLILVFFFSLNPLIYGQETLSDVIFPHHIRSNCEVMQPRKKMKGRRYATVPPIYLRSGNTNYTYAVFHLGKRGGQLYMYIDVLAPTVCFKEGKIIDIRFKNGEIITLENEYHINCDGIFATRIFRKLRKALMSSNISKIELFSYNKNYAFFVSDIQDLQIKENIKCLLKYDYTR